MPDPSRLVTASRVDEDVQYEAGLRPRTLDDYIGQERVRASYRDNYDRLAQTKGRYDPENVFCINQNICPPETPEPAGTPTS